MATAAIQIPCDTAKRAAVRSAMKGLSGSGLEIIFRAAIELTRGDTPLAAAIAGVEISHRAAFLENAGRVRSLGIRPGRACRFCSDEVERLTYGVHLTNFHGPELLALPAEDFEPSGN